MNVYQNEQIFVACQSQTGQQFVGSDATRNIGPGSWVSMKKVRFVRDSEEDPVSCKLQAGASWVHDVAIWIQVNTLNNMLPWANYAHHKQWIRSMNLAWPKQISSLLCLDAWRSTAHLLLKSSEADEEASEEKVEASCIFSGKGVVHV